LSDCGLAVSSHASLPIAFRLYLPEDWAADPVRRARAGVPEDVVFETKPQIALDEIRAARAEGVPEGIVLADAGYGINTAFRTALTCMGLSYVVGLQSSALAAGSGSAPAQGMERARPAADADAARRAEQASMGRAARQVVVGQRMG
jgi:SRSO17 transposase